MAIRVLRDDYKLTDQAERRIDSLPPFRFAYVELDGQFIPASRGTIETDHPHWDFILEPGTLTSTSGGFDLSLPVTLQERDANCMHNGVVSLRFSSLSNTGEGQFTVSSETCLYLKADMTVALTATLQPASDLPVETLRRAHLDYQKHRLPVASFEQFKQHFPGVSAEAFGAAGSLAPEDLTLWGLLIDGVHYRGGCQTRAGEYPHCDALSLPSYSLAKSLAAGLGVMALEKAYPGSSQRYIADLVPECDASGNWADVTLLQSLNMVTGNYGEQSSHTDEASAVMETGFFIVSTHADKIAFSCNAWPRRAQPGTTWVYHTSDTYIAGTAINAALREATGDPGADYYRDLLVPQWRELNLAPAVDVPRRTRDTERQAYSGYGMTLNSDDVVRIGQALNEGAMPARIHQGLLDQALQRDVTNRGFDGADGSYYYQHGFWGFDVTELLGCQEQTVIPFMSGYGGINVVLMPNDSVYYYFSDGGRFHFRSAVLASHQIRPLCTARTHAPGDLPL